jgi:hypothetical protein
MSSASPRVVGRLPETPPNARAMVPSPHGATPRATKRASCEGAAARGILHRR